MATDETLKDFFKDRGNGTAAERVWMASQDRYFRLRAMYANNDLYDGHPLAEAMKPLRTAVNRSVEFYVAKTFPSKKLEVRAEQQAVVDAIERVQTWSNFDGMKPAWLRTMALLGDLFLKVMTRNGKVWYELIEPELVTDFTTNSRGYLQTIRIDVELGGGLWFTEYWDKSSWMVWDEHMLGKNTPIDELGAPSRSGSTASFGIDFVPIVHAKFKNTGALRGAGADDHAIDKLDEANRKSTRLAQMIFRYNKPLWVALAGGADANGLPSAPPLTQSDLDNKLDSDDVVMLNGSGSLESLVANLNYDSFLAILNADIDEIEKDLPELRYYSLKDSQMSGKAISLLLGAALDRAAEARNNFSQAIQRCNEIALTMGANIGALQLSGLSYDRGDFDHELIVDASFSEDISEKATTFKTLTDGGMEVGEALLQAGITPLSGGVVQRNITLTVGVISDEEQSPPTGLPAPAEQPGAVAP